MRWNASDSARSRSVESFCASGDRPEAALLHFYQNLRAAVRARLAALHLRAAAYRGSPRWIERTRCDLGLASAHLQRCRRLLHARAGLLG
ncbi:hypothetical protein P5W99_37305 [Paraburkholderia sp. A3BS-1L]|uniref:hypothetical protein n=1 Tax=Paraburkholderia sp. A3BS-1L TaxID=3028375 RepID=UPI003DAA1ACE